MFLRGVNHVKFDNFEDGIILKGHYVKNGKNYDFDFEFKTDEIHDDEKWCHLPDNCNVLCVWYPNSNSLFIGESSTSYNLILESAKKLMKDKLIS